MMKMEHDMKIIDGHVHLVQYIAGTGAGGELRFAGKRHGGIRVRGTVQNAS